MELKEIEIDGRKYKAYFSPDIPHGAEVIVGPPEGLVDRLGLPEPSATRLHNILYERGILNYDEARKKGVIFGAWQEFIGLDASRILEEFNQYQKVEI